MRRRNTADVTQYGWEVTFCDLVYLLLTFFVLQYATTTLRPRETPRDTNGAESLQSFTAELKGDETTVVHGAFTPTDSDTLSYRGRTALIALARQTVELGRDLKLSLRLLSSGNQTKEEALKLLNRQRMSVLRQLLGAGLPLHAIVVTPIDTLIPDRAGDAKEANSLTSRLELTIQEKRS